jgi:hypothetical protein
MPVNRVSWNFVKLTRIVSGALRSCVQDHPAAGVDADWIASAAKRVVGQLKDGVAGWLDEQIEEAEREIDLAGEIGNEEGWATSRGRKSAFEEVKQRLGFNL